MTEPTSSGAGAMPPAGTPVTGTPAPGSATPQVAALTLEEALKKIADLEQHAQNKAEEAARHGKNLTTAEKELAAYKAAEQAAKDAQLSEVERMNKQYADLKEQHETLASELLEARVYQDVARHAAKLNFILPADMLAKLLLNDLDAIEFEDGKPKNIETLLQNLAKSTPEIVKSAQQEQQQQQRAPAVPAMNPGRSSIASPGQQQPGRIPRLNDPGLWK